MFNSINKKLYHQAHPESGIALIVVAFVLIILSGFLSLGLGVFEQPSQIDFTKVTEKKQETILNHLSAFSQEYFRLPCPANPDATSRDENYGMEDRNNGAGSVCNRFEGIIPFRTLGLQERDAEDGWNRLMTYAVSSAFTNLDAIDDTNVDIGVQCTEINKWVFNLYLARYESENDPNPAAPATHQAFYDPPITAASVYRSMNPGKAKFCCLGLRSGGSQATTFYDNSYGAPNEQWNDLQIQQFGNPIILRQDTGATGRSSPLLNQDIDTPTNVPLPANIWQNNNTEVTAISVVSHGLNGFGSYTGGSATAKYACPVAGPEAENCDTDRIFEKRPSNFSNTNNYFDDIVTHATQFQIYSRLGSSCTTPYR